MFQQLRALVHQQPQLLESVLQQVSASNPQLAHLIASNPNAFVQLLAETGDGDENPEGQIPMPPGANNVVSVTEEEREAIERVSSNTFPIFSLWSLIRHNARPQRQNC